MKRWLGLAVVLICLAVVAEIAFAGHVSSSSISPLQVDAISYESGVNVNLKSGEELPGMISGADGILLPQFKLPWDDKLNREVLFSGGPHSFAVSNQAGEYGYGSGSGIDFSTGKNKPFPVSAMASGKMINAECLDSGLGCYIAIKHDVGKSVLIYGHLDGNSAKFREWSNLYKLCRSVPCNVIVPQGSELAMSGNSGNGGGYHLHVELRDGSRDSYPFGDPVGWETMELLNGQVDGYWIYGYAKGDPNKPNLSYQDHQRFYNYDGVAVRGNERKLIRGFRYIDVPGPVDREDVVTYVGTNFLWPRNDCTKDCEIQTDEGTQFAKTAAGGAWLNRNLALPASLSSGGHGVLFSSNRLPIPASDNARFVRDVTIPDGTVVSPNQSLAKTWRLRNTGQAAWGAGYQLAFVSGKQMGAPSAVNVPATSPGQEVNVSVNLTAPGDAGVHRGYWQMRNPQGTYFGDRIWVEIEVPGAPGSTNPPSVDAFTLRCVDCPGAVTPGQTFRPTVEVTVNSGQLIEGRGDMLRNTDGNLFGAWPHVAVKGIVNSGQSHTFTFYADNPIKAPDAQGDYESKWRLWQNGQFVGPELKIQFKVQNQASLNQPPRPPSPTDPGDWAVFTSTPTLKANHNGDPDNDAITQYYFEIFDSHDIPKSGWINSSSWTPPTLGYFGYQWRVKVKDSRGAESGWSEVRHFNIKNPTPQIYSFSWQWCHEPWGPPDKICFCAETSGGGLELRINSANDGSESGTWKTIANGDTNFRCTSDNDRPPNFGQLEWPSGQYRIRLYQRPNVGGWDAANTADITIPVASNQRPGPPFTLNPSHDSYLDSRTVGFNWQTTYRTDQYRLQVSTQSNFSSFLVDQTFPAGITNYTHTFDSEYQTLYWRVTSTGPYGSNNAGSYFHIDQTPPSSTIKALPAVVTEDKFTVGWSGSDSRSGLQWYHVQFREGNRPDSTWTDWLVNTTKTAVIFQGQPGQRYYFRVRAMDKIGNWEEWPAGDGDANTLVDPTAVPAEAWWNNSYALKHNLVILNNDSATLPAHYPVRIHLDNSTTPTAAEVYNASLTTTKGNDVRVVYQDTTELNRFVQYFSSSRIDIWFPLAAALGGGGTANGTYQLYYGNSAAGAPPANVNAVFLPEADANTMGLWHFQEGTGTAVSDSSGRNHPATFHNAAWVDNLLGNAGRFNGSNAYADAGTSNDFTLGAGPMTLEAWIYITGNTGGYPHIMSKWGSGSAGASYFFRVTGGRNLHWLMRADGGNREIYSSTVLDPNRWYHVAATYNGTNTIRVYVNGNMVGQNTNAADAFSSTNRFLIGYAEGGADGSYFPGYIQHARISNIERTSFPYGKIVNQPSASVGVARPKPVAGDANLRVLFVTTYLTEEGKILVEAVIENYGDRDTANGFFTDLYVNRAPGGPNDLSGSIRFWINDPIPPFSTVTLTTLLDPPTLRSAMGRTTREAMAESSGLLYAQVDSTGVVAEPNNSDNITAQGTEFCFAESDAFENDNSDNRATALGLNAPQSHNFHSLSDEDWFKVELSAGKSYVISTSNLGANSDTYLYLYDRDGKTLILANDDTEDSIASSITWTPPKNGTYYVLVKHWNPNGGGCGTAYTVTLAEEAVCYWADVNCDNSVSIIDVQLVASRWGTEKGDPGYEPAFDVDDNDRIDIIDVQLVAGQWPWPKQKAARQADQPTEPAAQMSLSFDPAQLNLGVGETKQVAVQVAGAMNLAAFETAIDYNPSLLKVESVTLTDYLGGSGRTIIPVGPIIDNAAGTVSFGAATLGAQPGVNGDGVLAEVQVTGLASGNGAFDMHDSLATDPDGQTLSLSEVDGSYQITGGALSAPTISAIVNPDRDGNYTVNWQSVTGATSYALHEQRNSGVWQVVYSGSKTSSTRSGRSPGQWCYRARATNGNSNSDWSAVVCTTVEGLTATYTLYLPGLLR